MGAQRELWMRIVISLFLSGMSLFLLSWYLESKAAAKLESSKAPIVTPLPALQFLEPLPGTRLGLPFRACSLARIIELVEVPLGARARDQACLLEFRAGVLYLRRPEQVPSKIHLRSPPLSTLSPMQRTMLLKTLEDLLAGWGRDPSELRFPPGEAYRTLALWMRRDPIPWARR